LLGTTAHLTALAVKALLGWRDALLANTTDHRVPVG
jgi:hypothetical protein